MCPDRFSFFFPSVANNSGFILKVGAQTEQYTTDRSNSCTLGLDFLLYIPPHMLIHIHLDSLLTDNFLPKINYIFHQHCWEKHRLALKRLVAHYVKEPNCKELNLQHKMHPTFFWGSAIKAFTQFFRIIYDIAHLYQTFLYFTLLSVY